MNKVHIQISCILWLIYIVAFLIIDLKFIFSIIGLIGLIGTKILIKKNKKNEFSSIINKLNAITYCCFLIFSIFIIVQITGFKGFNWLYFSLLFIIDHHFFYFINWTPWREKKKKEKKEKGKTREWIESVLFAVFAATLIHIFTIQPYIIPTSSLEGTLLRGDFLFVSKFHYGANVPNTPLFLPFMHNTLPFTKNTPSYLDWIQLGYNRLPGFQKIKNNDIVVFNWPTDDTNGTRPNMPFDKKLNYVKRCIAIPGDNLEIENGDIFIDGKIQDNPNRAIIQHAYWVHYNKKEVRKTWGELKKELHNKYKIELAEVIANNLNFLPTSDRDINNLNIRSFQDLIVHGSEEEIKLIENAKSITRITDLANDSTLLNKFKTKFPDYRIDSYNQPFLITSLFPQPFEYEVTFKEIRKNCGENILLDNISAKTKEIGEKEYTEIVQFKTSHNWDNDNFGPIYMPKEGDEIILNESNIALYANIITDYENNTLEIIHLTTFDCTNVKKEDLIEEVNKEYIFKINGKETNKYTIKMDNGYYWMVGDNRHNSQDSRCWGFVPFSHVVGKPLLVWLSVDWNADNLFNKIRWKRLFTTVHGEGESRWYFPHFMIILILFIFRKRLKKIIRKITKSKNKNHKSDQTVNE